LGGIGADALGFTNAFAFLIFVVVGGEKTFWGSVIGAAVLTILPEVLRFSLYDRYILYGIILLLVLIFWPKGLLQRSRLGERNWLSHLINIIKNRFKQYAMR
jgi:branched-chain amino acid transport system permease protein